MTAPAPTTLHDLVALRVSEPPAEATPDQLAAAHAAQAAHRARIADWHDLLTAYDRLALREAARGPDDRLAVNWLSALLSARTDAERAAMRHVSARARKAGR